MPQAVGAGKYGAQPYTAGFGYAFNKQSERNFVLSVVPKVSVTGSGAAMPRREWRQVNWQLLYSYTFWVELKVKKPEA